MTRPDDIPVDIWEATAPEFDRLYLEDPNMEGGSERGVREMAARLVLAERERCAKVADFHAEVWCDSMGNPSSVIATAIRAGTLCQ